MKYATLETSFVSVVPSDLREVITNFVDGVIVTTNDPIPVELFASYREHRTTSAAAMFVFAMSGLTPETRVVVPMKSVAAPP
jgi:hypothetical protein